MFVRFLACSVAVTGIAVAGPFAAAGPAGAVVARCTSIGATNMTIIDGINACGAESDGTGNATAYGDGGIGYAKAQRGALAIGVGLDGGVGASQGVGGIPAAVGIGPGSVAIASVASGALSLALALNNSQALVADADQGVICQGPSALAWNAQAGRFCVATPVGLWSYK
ncbi:hypothetical protein OG921_07440 [Aldersonia sp. NBC_00410]|uniref:DUF6764 family protein n=1 Tax=Aldersonia sp. NBC_00410 TaxID=2975954 RepID=UPI00224ED8F3|nr:DUF6764 family protein [Aldersonia sp. NBC_00410]MCX5043000.1 hypothetical protein [Aldersonia sp. NBC_00410]